MSQPSPSWLDNTLRNLTLYVKRTEFSNSNLMNTSQTKLNTSQSAANSFNAFKKKLHNNIGGKKSSSNSGTTVLDESMPEVAFPSYFYAKLSGGSTANYTEDIRKLELIAKP
jgi:hypothetical protein